MTCVIPFNLSTNSGSGGGGSSVNGPQGVDLLHLSPAQEVNHVCNQVGYLCLGVLNLEKHINPRQTLMMKIKEHIHRLFSPHLLLVT